MYIVSLFSADLLNVPKSFAVSEVLDAGEQPANATLGHMDGNEFDLVTPVTPTFAAVGVYPASDTENPMIPRDSEL